jgi:Carboxypeptidase regulatory-like domain
MRLLCSIALLLSAQVSAPACSCIGPNPVCSAFTQSPVIFRGTVVDLTLIKAQPTQVRNLDGTASSIIGGGLFKVDFVVNETFRGEPRQLLTVYTNEQGSMCGFPFKRGLEYVVFTFPNPVGNLTAGTCSHTHEISPNGQDADVTWLRNFPTAPPGASIFGNQRAPAATAPPSLAIQIRGPENRDLNTGKDGSYSVSGLQPGKYAVSAIAPSGLRTANTQTVTVADKGCAEVDWYITYDSHIRGQLTQPDGTPVPNVAMQLTRRDPTMWNDMAMVSLITSDAQGRYDFREVPPGDYFIVANSLGPSPTRPYPTYFYPGTEDKEAAATLHLGPSESVHNVDLVLPAAWKSIVVQAKVLMLDGHPALNAQVQAHDLNYLTNGELPMATTDGIGEASLTVYDGRAYYLTALISGGTQQRCAGPLKFTAKSGLVLEPITIEHNWGNCLAQLNPRFRPPASIR